MDRKFFICSGILSGVFVLGGVIGMLVFPEAFFYGIVFILIGILWGGRAVYRACTRVSAPYPIVYVRGRNVKVLPYLHKRRLHEVWGVLFFGRLWKKTAEKNVNWYRAQEMARSTIIDGRSCTLTPVGDCGMFGHFQEAFNKEMQFLRQYGLEADDIVNDGVYWANYGIDDCGFVYHVEQRQFFRKDKQSCADLRMSCEPW